ncbi:MAG: HipA N-terminal domain-containing protein [Imperialibacter sp.]|uniref:HipA N-terminal domain-containing protein n=1 Tax=Imperialibacter sp. TaxID=2038411 RepID=UPI003A86191A
MRAANILFKDQVAGVLTQQDDGTFNFRYLDGWMADSSKPAISLTLPKSQQEHYSSYLFPFFFNMLPEGSNKQVVCHHMKLDADDYFGILMATAKTDAIGAIRVVKVESQP